MSILGQLVAVETSCGVQRRVVPDLGSTTHSFLEILAATTASAVRTPLLATTAAMGGSTVSAAAAVCATAVICEVWRN